MFQFPPLAPTMSVIPHDQDGVSPFGNLGVKHLFAS